MEPTPPHKAFSWEVSEVEEFSALSKHHISLATGKTPSKEAPPSYEPADSALQAPDLTSAFANLQLHCHPSPFPTTDSCLAHLKLLSVFHALKEDIGYTDGLFGLWDVRVEKIELAAQEATLAKMREKRWALFVARAVERFQDWWNRVLCMGKERLAWKGMLVDTSAFAKFTEVKGRREWRVDMLPPIDVLMVWHTFMLNPRSYLEDCIRFGVADFWASGMPWHAVNEAINDTTVVYEIPEEGKADFESKTGRRWNNADDPMTKKIQCPKCSRNYTVPWTICAGEDASWADITSMKGTGYGDPDFSHPCAQVSHSIDHDMLVVEQLRKDIKNVQHDDYPMRGTILTPSSGQPDGATAENWDNRFNFFPNRLAKIALPDEIARIIRGPNPSMETVKIAIERIIGDKDEVKKINTKKDAKGNEVTGNGILSKQEKVALRKMLAGHWGNSSIFCLELGGAVVRQAVFVDKMCQIDWLHSPNARETMGRLIMKYERFLKIMTEYPKKMAVPTLDVDLAWHTHQLSPKAYYEYTVSKCRRFVNHDDKLEEDTLADGFEWTSKQYQKLFHEVYSECTCWYCETIRSRHISSTAKVIGLSTQYKVLDKFHTSGLATLCPPNRSAHISSHNAVTTTQNSMRTSIHAALARRRQAQLDEAYAKAQARAAKKGRKIPPKDQYYVVDTWGYTYMMYGPWQAYPCYGAVYVGGDPCVVAGEGMPGSCAAGACSAAGADGGAACGNACGSACSSGGGGDGGGCGGGCGGCGG